MHNVLSLTKEATLESAISLLDANGNGVLPVLDENNKFLGIITDGDIRKAILYKKLDLSSVINTSPFTIDPKSDVHQRIQYLKQHRRRQLPLVDDDGNYHGMFTLDDIEFATKPNWIVLMVGGLGTRLGELTKDIPKPMLEVRGKPIVERIIENFVEQGFSNFYLAVNYKKEVIQGYFKDGAHLGINIRYIEEDKRLGTAGALSLIKEEHQAPLIVSNGDVLSNINYAELLDFHASNQSMATMCVKEYEHIVPYGVVNVDGVGITELQEKPRMLFNINSGVYCISPNVLNHVPSDVFYDMPKLFNDLMEKREKVTAFQYKQYWIDIGLPDDFKKANDVEEL